MKKANIIYHSKHGTTRAYAENIASLLGEWGLDAQALSIGQCRIHHLAEADYLLLGCWTSGLFFFGQHPDKEWRQFAKQLPVVSEAKVGLFTTYKLATGSMFHGMAQALHTKVNSIDLKLRSKSCQLNEAHKAALLQFIG